MIKRMRPLLLLACLCSASYRTHAVVPDGVASAVSTGVEFAKTFGAKVVNAAPEVVDMLDCHFGSIALSAVALTAGYAALRNCLDRRECRAVSALYLQYDKFVRKLSGASCALADCKRWADCFYMTPFDELGIEPEALDNQQTWTYVIGKLSSDVVASFARATGQADLLSLDLKAKQQYAKQVFEEYKDSFCELERCVDKLKEYRRSFDDMDRIRSEAQYCLTMVPVYLKKMAFIQQLVEQRRCDFEKVAREHSTCYAEPFCCN